MNDQFASAMGQALEHTRAGNPGEATRILQAALNGTPLAGQTTTTAPARPRRPLGQIIDTLVNGKARGPAGMRATSKQPAVPTGATFEARRHDSTHGAREYRLFTPSPRDEPVQGLVMMLHGCTQNADDFAVGTGMILLAERHNVVVVFPDQTRAANHMGCWNWFRPEDQTRDRGEPAILADLARKVAAECGVSADRTYVAGLSAGGAMAAILGAVHGDVFAAAGVHSGLAPGAASDVASAFSAMQGQGAAPRTSQTAPRRTIVFHGSADSTVAPANADAVLVAALGQASLTQIEDTAVVGARVTLHRDAAGRTVAERWIVPGMGHAWSGGSSDGSHTDPNGPDASEEMLRFFLNDGRGEVA